MRRALAATGPVPSALLAGLVLVWLSVHLAGLVRPLPAWSTSYLDDLVCLPLVLGFILLLQRIKAGSSGLVLPVTHGLAGLVLFSVWFEVILPGWSNRHTGDPWDAVLYGLGFIIFQGVVNRPGNPEGGMRS